MPQKQAEYRLAPAAERDLEAIWLFTFETWGLDQANEYTDRLTDLFAQLADGPNLGSACNHIREGYRRRHVGRHVLYYRITAYGIAVIRILHDRMSPERHL